MRRPPAVAVVVILLLLASPVAAQTTDEDHERADAAYLERLKQAEAAKSDEPGPLTDFSVFLEQAEELVRDRNYRSASGERYRVQTDDPRLDPEAAVALLESFADYIDQQWADRLELAPFGEPSRVFLFYSFHKYNKLLGHDFSRSWTRPKGHYGTVIDALAAHTDADFPGGFADVLVHEGAHQLVARRFYPGEAEPSPWITEGIASYFGFTWRDDDGAFVEGEIGGKRAGLIRDEREGRAVEPRSMVQGVKRLLRQAEPDANVAAKIVSIETPGQFYSGNSSRNYAVSWLLIHALMHAEGGTHADGFIAYLERERAGEPGLEALLETTGLDEAGLDDLLRTHLKGLKTR